VETAKRYHEKLFQHIIEFIKYAYYLYISDPEGFLMITIHPSNLTLVP